MNDNSGLYFIVGGLAVLVIGVLYFGGVIPHGSSTSKSTTIERTLTPDPSSTTTATTTKPN